MNPTAPTTNAPADTPAPTPTRTPFVVSGGSGEAGEATVTPTPGGDAHPLLPFGPSMPTYQQED